MNSTQTQTQTQTPTETQTPTGTLDYGNLPINDLIDQLSSKKGSPILFEELKNELLRKDDTNKSVYCINVKECADLAILYYNEMYQEKSKDPLVQQLERSCRSCIIDKTNLKIVATQFNKIVYNDEAKELLNNNNNNNNNNKPLDWNKIVIQRCYEGTMVLLFHHNNIWYVSTRRCLKAEDSSWIKNKSYREMFDEAMLGKFSFDELNKDYCYNFILIHHKNRNIVNYSHLGKDYKELYHSRTTKKYTMEEVDAKINDKVRFITPEKFDSLQKLYETLDKISNEDKQQFNITTEGFVITAYNGEPHKSSFCILKLQTDIYQYLMKLKPNNSNIHQSYLELYQKDKLTEFLPFFTRYSNDIIKRINIAMKTIAKELLDLYHCTRQKKNPHIYNSVSDMYKKVLYGLHGLYIENRKKDFHANSTSTSNSNSNSNTGGTVSNPSMNNHVHSHAHVHAHTRVTGTQHAHWKSHTQQAQAQTAESETESRSINVHDVYHFLKQLPSNDLRQLFFERMSLLEDPTTTFINKCCIYTMTQSILMFKNNSGGKKY